MIFGKTEGYGELSISFLNSKPNNTILRLSKSKVFADEKLTLSQTTNFGLFQSERVCRRQFQI